MAKIDSRVEQLVAELTIEEKIQLVHGAANPDGAAAGSVPGVECDVRP